MEFVIREILPKDNPQVSQLIRDVMSSYNCVGEGYSIQDLEVSDMYTYYQSKKARYYVLVHQDKIYGGAGIAQLDGAADTICELKKMYFYSDARGLGYGKKILDLLLADARHFGYTHCYLETVDRMEAAAKLYEKFGFSRRDQCLGNTGHSGCDSFYMKQLA